MKIHEMKKNSEKTMATVIKLPKVIRRQKCPGCGRMFKVRSRAEKICNDCHKTIYEDYRFFA